MNNRSAQTNTVLTFVVAITLLLAAVAAFLSSTQEISAIEIMLESRKTLMKRELLKKLKIFIVDLSSRACCACLVSNSSNGVDDCGIFRIMFDFGPQSLDVNIYQARIS